MSRIVHVHHDELLDALPEGDAEASAQAVARYARRPVPAGRVLALACLAPILAMVVLGASRFDAIRAIGVESILHVTDAPADNATSDEDGLMFNVSRGADVALVEPGANDAPSAEAMTTSPSSGYRTVRVQMMDVTAYCACPKCCGKNARGITASGKPVSYNRGRFVAAPKELRFGTKVRVPFYHGGEVVEVVDRGGAIKGDKLDVYFADHNAARRWGRQKLPVEIVEEVTPPVSPVPTP